MHRAFTLRSNGGILRQLQTQVAILPTTQKKFFEVNAIWDTGATGSAITTKVVQELGLIPTGKAHVSTANGLAVQNTYTIDIALPNSVTIIGIIATEIDALSAGCDALIGMDLITLGDFSITNHKGVTCISFRVPSGHEIDYVKNLTYGITPIRSGKPTNYTPSKKKRK